ncbi:DUF6090 family protein [Yeosuana sp. MJ-SS3]|uniref:DUF6090 family protein n=1 Tax=Gilvirhabdus luticola TaxID=3079858 RepID=A0ABU3U4B7_9FLAO|nr:DUF6090 family protein [Yeosuana sp. MJ-SS3]MDU8885264.1 DUF6090 family protein [Yeosuana sp. MJ-SS3]
MLKFFRKIRQQLITNGRAKKYFLYAIGEIILVVVGILIALQINNWNENRKDRILEKEYLNRILVDIKSDQELLKVYTIDRYARKVECLEKTKAYYQGDYIITDTIQFLNDVGYGGVYGFVDWFLNKNTYNELISTGNLRKIESDSLRTAITTYYEISNALQNSAKNYISGYIKFINSLKVFDINNPESISEFDQKFMLKHIKSEEFYRLTNLELTLAHRVTKFADRIKKQSEELVIMVDDELKD